MLNNYFNQLVNKILEIVAIDTTQSAPHELSPFGKGVGECLNNLDSFCKSLGFETHNEDGYYLTATMGKGEEFGILGHVDVVPYNKDEWSANPLGELKENVLYGRGVLDDKGPMLCCLFAVKQLLDEGYSLKRKVKFIFGGNEESGWECINRYNQVDIMPKEGISPDADFPVINCEKGICEIKLLLDKPASLVYIRGGSRSNIVMSECKAVVDKVFNNSDDKNISIFISDFMTQIKAVGKPAHGSTPDKGDNACHHLLKYLALNDPAFEKLSKLLCHTDGSGAFVNLSDHESGALTFNVGVIDTVKDKIEVTLDIRFPISFTKKDILQKINSAFGTTGVITHYHDPLFVNKNHPLVKKLLAAYTLVTGDVVEPITIGGGTYARALPSGVAFGPIFPNQESTIHQADECVALSCLKKAYQVYLEALKSICFN